MNTDIFKYSTSDGPVAKVGKERGFTLVELVVTVALVAIITAVAIPSYSNYMENTRRTDAMSFLSEVAGEQERFFTLNNAYAADMSDLGYGASPTAPSPEGHYTVSIARPNGATSYRLTAAPTPGGAQAGDTTCGSFIVSSTGARSNSVAGANCW